jgi:plastocyanin
MTRFFSAARGGALVPLALALALVLAACGGGSEESAAASGDNTGGGTVEVVDGNVELTAADLAFDATTIVAPAGEAFTITLVNNDSAPHNVSVYVEEGGDSIVQGDVINGGETVTVEVPALDAGEYFFVCDLHTEMNGTVVVEG